MVVGLERLEAQQNLRPGAVAIIRGLVLPRKGKGLKMRPGHVQQRKLNDVRRAAGR